MQDTIEHGTVMRGEKSARAKVTREDIDVMREMRKGGALFKEIGPRFGISKVHASRILAGTRWTHLADEI
jgi:hypothetical protein